MIIEPSGTPTPEITAIVTVEPTTIPTTAPITIEPTEIPTTQPTIVTTLEVTTEPTTIPTTAPITVEPTEVPTTLPTTVVTIEVTADPTVLPTTAIITAEPTMVPTTQPIIAAGTTPLLSDNSTEIQEPVINESAIGSIAPTEVAPVILVTGSNGTIELNQSSGSPQPGGFNLSWTMDIIDPPLNETNLQGSGSSQYWEINASTGPSGSTNLYPLDKVGLTTNFLFGIWIHDVSNIILDGMGRTLQYNGPANQGATGVVINNTEGGTNQNIKIVNLTLLGWDTGISIQNSDNVYVMDNVTVTGNKDSSPAGITGSGIVVKDSTNVFIASNLSAGFVTVQNNGQDGIVFNNVTGGLINNTYVGNNRNTGINLTSSRGVTVQNVTATGNSQHGILLYGSSNNNLTSNNVSGNEYHGIILESSSNNTLTDNMASGNKHSGIILYQNSNYNNLTNNNASGNSQYGIVISNSSNNNLTSNTANLNSDGILLYGSSNNNLTGNIASENSFNGI
ncbi:MAG: right-handed parallel beta-helix repeat-containing protein, partial [Methanomicrobiales archaeon]